MVESKAKKVRVRRRQGSRVASAVAIAASLGLADTPVWAQTSPAVPPAASSGAPARGAAPVPVLSAEQIAIEVQKFYEGARTFQATFEQTYTIRAYNRKKEDRGHVAFAKPGKMSWRYDGNGNRVISDGRVLQVYERQNEQVYEQAIDKSGYPAALSFLVGEGKLSSSFVLTKESAENMPFEGGYVLLALPREPSPAYQKMYLYVDGKTFQVRRVLMLDAQGNRNRFTFSQPLVNLPVPESEFRFTPPAGTRIVKP